MTELDLELLRLVQSDGRQSNREIASQLGISPKQVGARMRRLLESGSVRIIATVDSSGAGFHFMLAIAVAVSGPVDSVASKLAAIPNVLVVMRMAGQYDIEIVVVAESHAALSSLIKDHLSQIGGVRSLHPSLILEVTKFETGFNRIDAGVPLVSWPENAIFDTTDKGIVEQLWQNARASNEAIGAALDLSESTVRSRIAQMRRRNLLHITAIRNVELGRDLLFAFVGVELAHNAREGVLNALVAMPQVAFAATVLGRFDILAQVSAPNIGDLTKALDLISALPGVGHASCSQGLSLVKYDARFSMLATGAKLGASAGKAETAGSNV